jgi:hypothetical protein
MGDDSNSPRPHSIACLDFAITKKKNEKKKRKKKPQSPHKRLKKKAQVEK